MQAFCPIAILCNEIYSRTNWCNREGNYNTKTYNEAPYRPFLARFRQYQANVNKLRGRQVIQCCNSGVKIIHGWRDVQEYPEYVLDQRDSESVSSKFSLNPRLQARRVLFVLFWSPTPLRSFAPFCRSLDKSMMPRAQYYECCTSTPIILIKIT